VYGVTNGLSRIFFFRRLTTWLGMKRTFTIGIVATVIMYASFPIISTLADWRGGVDGWVYAAIGVQVTASMMISFSYGWSSLPCRYTSFIISLNEYPGCIFIFITASSPNRASLGSTNGLCQMVVSWMRAFGPGLANSLYSFSLRERSWTVYYVLEALSVVAIAGACFLPRSPWQDANRK
jgi:hypothetical protein